MSERLRWVRPFDAIGISCDDLFSMSESEFNQKCQFCLECGLEPAEDMAVAKAIAMSLEIPEKYYAEQPKPVEQKNATTTTSYKPHDTSGVYSYTYSKNKPQRTESGKIRDMQNSEYERLQKEEAKRLQEEAKHEEERKSRVQNKEKPKQPAVSPKENYKAKAKKLPPEPANGLRIGFTFHDGKRLVRKFAPNTKGEDLKTLIQAEDNMFNPDGTPIGFSLQQTLGPMLDLNKTLEAQGIKKSAMFSVVLDD